MANNCVDQRPTVCDLTQEAMDTLGRLADRLGARPGGELTGLEVRALLWARCALAALYGIRVDEVTPEWPACRD